MINSSTFAKNRRCIKWEEKKFFVRLGGQKLRLRR